jgi:hypothetical protein
LQVELPDDDDDWHDLGESSAAMEQAQLEAVLAESRAQADSSAMANDEDADVAAAIAASLAEHAATKKPAEYVDLEDDEDEDAPLSEARAASLRDLHPGHGLTSSTQELQDDGLLYSQPPPPAYQQADEDDDGSEVQMPADTKASTAAGDFGPRFASTQEAIDEVQASLEGAGAEGHKRAHEATSLAEPEAQRLKGGNSADDGPGATADDPIEL